MPSDEGLSVTAAEFVRSFSKLRENANRAPVFITNHGRTTHVMISTQTYDSLIAGDHAPPGLDEVETMAEWIDEAVIICDRELRIEFTNRVAGAICRKPSGELVGRELTDALPEIAGSLMEVHARRTLIGGEPSAAELPSPFRENGYLRFQCFPIGERNVLIFRDITEEVKRYRLADVKTAMLEAMTLHGSIGYVRISVRGSIDRVDDHFCNMLELPEDRLIGIQLVDLVDLADRPAFREALEQIMRGGEARNLTSRFITNKSALVETRVSMVPLHGAYGSEGAVIVLTPASSAEAELRMRA